MYGLVVPRYEALLRTFDTFDTGKRPIKGKKKAAQSDASSDAPVRHGEFTSHSC